MPSKLLAPVLSLLLLAGQPLAASGQTETAAFNLAGGYFRAKDYRKSLLAFEKIVAVDPNNARAITGVGLCSFELHDYARARREGEKSLALAPHRSDTLSLIWKLMFHYKEFFEEDDALAMLELIRRDNPKETEYYTCLADLLLIKGDTTGALAAIDKYIAIRPKFDGGYWAKAGIQEVMKDFKGAIVSYTQCLQYSPDPFVTRCKRAHCYEMLLDWPHVIADQTANEKLFSDPKVKLTTYQKTIVLISRSLAYRKSGQIDKALKDLDSVIAIYSSDKANMRQNAVKDLFDALCTRAELLVSLKRYPEAVTAYSALIEHTETWGEPYSGYYSERARLYRILGKNELAQKDEATAAKLNAGGPPQKSQTKSLAN